MRKDLNKVMCEHERARSYDKFHNYRHDKNFEFDFDGDDESHSGVSSANRESMKSRYNRGYERKEFSENLNPLYGFVRKSAGRRWDDIYSEICQTFDKRSVINQHILIHLFQYVEKETRMGEDGGVWFFDGYYARFSPTKGWRPITECSSEYFVHPTTNILTKNDRKSYRQEAKLRAEQRRLEELSKRRVINKTTELLKINNCWFEVKFEDAVGVNETKMVNSTWRKNWLQTTTVFPLRFDVLRNGHYAEARVAVSKRQLSHKELRKYGLI